MICILHILLHKGHSWFMDLFFLLFNKDLSLPPLSQKCSLLIFLKTQWISILVISVSNIKPLNQKLFNSEGFLLVYFTVVKISRFSLLILHRGRNFICLSSCSHKHRQKKKKKCGGGGLKSLGRLYRILTSQHFLLFVDCLA